jgi:hypothetical protein
MRKTEQRRQELPPCIRMTSPFGNAIVKRGHQEIEQFYQASFRAIRLSPYPLHVGMYSLAGNRVRRRRLDATRDTEQGAESRAGKGSIRSDGASGPNAEQRAKQFPGAATGGCPAAERTENVRTARRAERASALARTPYRGGGGGRSPLLRLIFGLDECELAHVPRLAARLKLKMLSGSVSGRRSGLCIA